MNDFHDVINEIKDKTEKFLGEDNKKRGKGTKGGLQKMVKARVRKKITENRLRAKRAGAKGDLDWDRDEYKI